jgi:hypothetical protein
MKLSFEQHAELLKLADYFSKLKKSAKEKGIDLDSYVDEFKYDSFVTYVNSPEKEEVHQEKMSAYSYEKHDLN